MTAMKATTPPSWVMYSDVSPAARATAWLLADVAAQTPAGELPLLDRELIAYHLGLSRGDKTSRVLDELTTIGFLTIHGNEINPLTGKRRPPRDHRGRVMLDRFSVTLSPPTDYEGACSLGEVRAEFVEDREIGYQSAEAAGRSTRRGGFTIYRGSVRERRAARRFRPYVYVIGSPGSGRVKIGFTTDAMRRLRDLQASSPVLLRVLWFGNGTREIEERLHLRFHSCRTHGEWFEFGQRADPAVAVRQEALRMGATEVSA